MRFARFTIFMAPPSAPQARLTPTTIVPTWVLPSVVIAGKTPAAQPPASAEPGRRAAAPAFSAAGAAAPVAGAAPSAGAGRHVGIDIGMTAVVAESVARPDFRPRAGDRLAGAGVDDLQAQHEIDARFAGTDVAPLLRALDVVGAVDLSRSQDALGGAGEIRAGGERAEGGSACDERLATGGFDDS